LEQNITRPSGPGRPRSPQADKAILEATIAELGRVGYARMAIERVAARAGVGKTTIYRRHPSKISLVAAAARFERETRTQTFDTGSFTGDVEALLSFAMDMLGSIWARVLPGILAAAADDPAVAEEVQRFFVWRRVAVADLVIRGIGRGQVRPNADPELVYEMIDGPMLVRLLVTGLPLDRNFLKTVVEGVTRSVRPD
jgi:AcrR family transcriptional regulator